MRCADSSSAVDDASSPLVVLACAMRDVDKQPNQGGGEEDKAREHEAGLSDPGQEVVQTDREDAALLGIVTTASAENDDGLQRTCEHGDMQ